MRLLDGGSVQLRNIVQLGGGTVLGQALVIATMPIVTRMYQPEQMGQLGLFLSFIGFAGVAVALRLEMAIASSTESEDADYLLAISLAVIAIVSIVAGGVMYAMVRINILSFGCLPAWTAPLMTASLAFTGVFLALRYWFIRQQRFDEISRAVIAQGGGRALVPVALGAVGCGWIGLLAGEIVGRALGVSRMLALAWPQLTALARRWEPVRAYSVLRRNKKYPLVGLPSSFLDALAAALPLPLIASLNGTGVAGQFLLVQRLVSLPAGLIVASVSDAYHPLFVQTFGQQPAQLRPLLGRLARRLLLLASAIYLPISLVSPLLFAPLFGQQWHQAGQFMAIVAPINIAALVVSPISRVLYVINRIEQKLLFDAVSLMVPLASLYGLRLIGANIYWCLAAYTAMHIASSLIFFLVIWRACGKEAG